MKKVIAILALICISISYIKGQGILNAVYPIGDSPNIGYKTSMVPSIERIFFEANPILRMPFYNNIRRKLMSPKLYNSASTLYLGFRPSLRMYFDNSMPVKTPSYRISILGFQKLFRLKESKFAKNHLLAFSIESGHYSNGQAACAFDENIADGSIQCDSIYRLITPVTNLSNKLNRSSGNFSTNYTEVIVNYRLILSLDKNYIPTSGISLKVGINRYHNNLLLIADYGGYTQNDIKIYGKNRLFSNIEWFTTMSEKNCFFKRTHIDRISVSANIEYISKSHPFVNPWRIETTATLYFTNNLGVFISGIYGHDNYNYRFVDSGIQCFAGITFDAFPPFEIK